MKYQLDESLFSEYKEESLVESKLKEDINDGWDEEFEEEPVLGDLESFIYEIKNAVKGAYTGAHTYQELADYIERLAEDLENFADVVRMHEEDEDEGEEE